MFFKHIGRSCNRHRYNLAASLFGDLEAALLEREHIQFGVALAAGAFRVDAHGDAGFDIFNACQNCLETGFDVVTVDEQAVQAAHPCGEQRDFFHAAFCDVSGQSWAARVGDDDVKVAAVVADVEHRLVLRYEFLADDGQADAAEHADTAERPLDDA